jgi:soluble lytic murein transglycosylase-like protein
LKYVTLFLCLVTGASAGEYAVLRSGFRIPAQSHVLSGGSIELQTKEGTLSFPASEIAGFEQDDYIPPAPVEKPAEPPKLVIVENPTPEKLIEAAAMHNGLRPEFVRSVARAESGFHANAVSPKGALGLMQLMPQTAAELGANPRDPKQNAEAGARYLKSLLLKYQNTPDPVRMALAAYNAGPGAVERYRNIPPFPETQVYIERVLVRYQDELKHAQ